MNNKILIVDDTKSWLVFHERLINLLYNDIFEITTASSAMGALNLVKANRLNPYALIITDLQMELDFDPLLAGEWLIGQIKTLKEYDSTNIIIISSMYNIEDVAKKYKVDCISKSRLAANKLLMQYALEKNMPFLDKIKDINP